MFVSRHPKIWSLHQNWTLDRPEVVKLISVQAHLEIPNRPYRKLQLWILVSGLIWRFHTTTRLTTLTLKNLWFYSLHWLEFFHQNLHRQLFFSRIRLFKNEMLYVQSVNFVPPWQKISQLLLFFFFKITSQFLQLSINSIYWCLAS